MLTLQSPQATFSRHRIIARFGMMHMIGTNLCIWLNVLVQETEHEIDHLVNHNEDGIGMYNCIKRIHLCSTNEILRLSWNWQSKDLGSDCIFVCEKHLYCKH